MTDQKFRCLAVSDIAIMQCTALEPSQDEAKGNKNTKHHLLNQSAGQARYSISKPITQVSVSIHVQRCGSHTARCADIHNSTVVQTTREWLSPNVEALDHSNYTSFVSYSYAAHVRVHTVYMTHIYSSIYPSYIGSSTVECQQFFCCRFADINLHASKRAFKHPFLRTDFQYASIKLGSLVSYSSFEIVPS